MRIKTLRQAKADLFAKMKAQRETIAEAKRPATDEEKAAFKALEVEFDGVVEELEMEERMVARERTLAPRPDANTEAAETSVVAVKQKDEPQDFATFGEQLVAVIKAGAPGASPDPRLRAAATGLHEGVGSDGGFLVTQQTVSGIRERMYQTGQLLSRVSQQPIGEGFNGVKLFAVDETSRANGSRFGGVNVFWTAEAGEKQASKPKFREMDLHLKKIAGLVYMTDELMQDATALEAYINRILPAELMFRVEDSILSGTGAGMPLGILNSGATVSVPRTTPGAIVYEDIVNMWSRMWAPSRSTAVWLVDQSVEAQLYSMSLVVGTGGIPVFMPAGGIAGQPFSTLFGRPLIPYEFGAQLGTVGDIMLADLSQYVLIDKGGVQRASSIHVRFIYDETVLRFVYRVDGQPEWNSPLTPKSGGPTLAPFVLLAT